MGTLFYILLFTYPCPVSNHICMDAGVYTSVAECMAAGEKQSQSTYWRCKPMQVKFQEEADGRHVYVDLTSD